MAEAVRTLAEAAAAVRAREPLTLATGILWLVARSYAGSANVALALLKALLFSGERAAPRRIVVYTVGIVGDNVVLLPALAALRARWPEARITVVTHHQEWGREGAAGVLEPSPFKDDLVLLDRDPVLRSGWQLCLDERLSGLRADLFVNLSPFGNRGWLGAVVRELAFARKLGARRAVGFRMATWSRGRLFDRVQWRLVRNEPRRARDVLAELRLKPSEKRDLMPRDEAERTRLEELIRERGGNAGAFVVLHSGAKFAAKCWPAGRYAELGAWIADRYGATPVLTGSAGERDAAQRIVRAAAVPMVNLAGETTLTGLMELLRIAAGCIVNDTGTMHLAAMAGVPTVAIFSTRHSPTHWLPLGGNVVSLFSLPACRFCFNDTCGTGVCLAAISVDDVQRAFEQVVREPQA